VTIRAVVFDVGETLVDETRAWSAWADWLGIPRLTFLAVCGAVIARGGSDHLEPFRILRPDMDLAAEVRRREAAGETDGILAGDFYPDAVACLRAVHDAGYRVGVVGNQPATAEGVFRELGVPLDLVASSGSWGVHKPDPRFFDRLVAEIGLPRGDIAYVGDRIDNDVRPAAAAGITAIFLRRGPWGWIQALDGDPPEAAVTIESLEELPAALLRIAGEARATI
jgi:HAD superfamily hydrolase (TIGR01549 family)